MHIQSKSCTAHNARVEGSVMRSCLTVTRRGIKTSSRGYNAVFLFVRTSQVYRSDHERALRDVWTMHSIAVAGPFQWNKKNTLATCCPQIHVCLLLPAEAIQGGLDKINMVCSQLSLAADFFFVLVLFGSGRQGTLESSKVDRLRRDPCHNPPSKLSCLPICHATSLEAASWTTLVDRITQG